MELHLERGRIRAILPCATGTIIRTETDTFDYPGATVLPGFVDNHVHVLGLGTRLTAPSLHACTSAEECIETMKGADDSVEWIHGMGWDQELWKDTSLPDASQLDAAFPDRPVTMSRVDGHAMWANAAARRRAGVDSTAAVFVDNDMVPFWKAMPKPSREEIEARLLKAGLEFSRNGITEVHDMDVAPHVVEIMRELAESGKMPVRVQSFVSGQHDEWNDAGMLPAGGELQQPAGVKLYSDGALGSRGAALLAPYHDAPNASGELLLNHEQIIRAARLAIDAGWWCLATHAIGDAAVREVLDAYEVIRSWPDAADLVLRIEHAQHVASDDVARFAQLNVFACVQPMHCIDDATMAEKRLGVDRLNDAYRWRSLLDAGVRIGGGSDAPIASCSVLDGLAALVNRVPKGARQSWQQQECITVEEAIACYTTVAHASADLDYRRGSLEVGYDADLVILDRDPLTTPPSEISRIKVLATFMAGQRRYSA